MPGKGYCICKSNDPGLQMCPGHSRNDVHLGMAVSGLGCMVRVHSWPGLSLHSVVPLEGKQEVVLASNIQLN